MAAQEKPEGWNKFNAIAKQIVKADKADIDKKSAEILKARKRQERKK